MKALLSMLFVRKVIKNIWIMYTLMQIRRCSKILSEVDESVISLWKAYQNQSVVTAVDTVKEEKTD